MTIYSNKHLDDKYLNVRFINVFVQKRFMNKCV